MSMNECQWMNVNAWCKWINVNERMWMNKWVNMNE